MTPPSLREMALGVAGAFRLARFDLSGLALFDLTPRGAARSFWAAVLVLPGYLALAGMRGDLDATPTRPAEARFILELLAYAVSWTAFPVVMSYLTEAAGRAHRFSAFLCAYNWAAVVQMAVYLPTALLAQSGLLPLPAASGLALGVVLAMLFYQWFVMRATLALTALGATALTLADLATAVTINSLVGQG